MPRKTDYLSDATHYAYLAHDNLMRMRRINMDADEKARAIRAVIVALQSSIRCVEKWSIDNDD